MSIWDSYDARIDILGATKRERALRRAKFYISKKISDSLSWHEVLINDVYQTVSIVNEKDDLSIKRICSMPDENLEHGGIVDYEDSKWIITDVDANNEIYSSGIMRRCNYLLKWLNKNGDIIEKWCIVEDGTKYLIGEKQEDMMAVGDARIAVTISKDNDTNELSRGKRFLIDDLDSSSTLAYQITKPNKLFNVYNGKGVFKFILNETNLTDNDNVELKIADYYNWHSETHPDNEHQDKDITHDEIIANGAIGSYDDDKKVWL